MMVIYKGYIYILIFSYLVQENYLALKSQQNWGNHMKLYQSLALEQ